MGKHGLKLPEPRRLEEIDMTDSPNYCPYHRHLGHSIEDCWSFKDLVEDKYQKNLITISERYLLPEPAVHLVRHLSPVKSIFMVQHAEQPPTCSHCEETPKERALRCIIAQKDQQIADQRVHFNELVELVNKLMAQNQELKEAALLASRRIEAPGANKAAKFAKGKGKGVAITKDEPKPAKSTKQKGSIPQGQNKKYSFTIEAVKPLFNTLMAEGFQLPRSRKPEETNQVDDPLYCPFHRCLGHVIEDCWSLKDILEERHQQKQIIIPKDYLLPRPTTHSVVGPQRTVVQLKNQKNKANKEKGVTISDPCEFMIGAHLCSSDSSNDDEIVYVPMSRAKDRKVPEHAPSKAPDGPDDSSHIASNSEAPIKP